MRVHGQLSALLLCAAARVHAFAAGSVPKVKDQAQQIIEDLDRDGDESLSSEELSAAIGLGAPRKSSGTIREEGTRYPRDDSPILYLLREPWVDEAKLQVAAALVNEVDGDGNLNLNRNELRKLLEILQQVADFNEIDPAFSAMLVYDFVAQFGDTAYCHVERDGENATWSNSSDNISISSLSDFEAVCGNHIGLRGDG